MDLTFQHQDKLRFLMDKGIPTLNPEIPADENKSLVCLVDTGYSKTAIVITSKEDFDTLNSPQNSLMKFWFTVENRLLKPYCPKWKNFEKQSNLTKA